MIKQGDNLLIVFVRNPVLGKVKTRLARTIGDERAMQVYLSLVSHTVVIGTMTTCDRVVYFSEEIESDPLWTNEGYAMELQQGLDLGERMRNAFRHSFLQGYKKAVIIGSDCPELTAQIITTAFESLDNNDVVIGPAMDGGYYLLGMKKLHESIFTDKKWSTENVALDTILDLRRENLTYTLLQTLSDVDEEKDLELMKGIIPL